MPPIDVEELTRSNALLAHSDYTVPEAMRDVARHRPSAVFDGPVLVVRSDTWGAHEDDLGWSMLATGPLTAVEVPVEHLGLMRRPAVEKVGAHVSDAPRSRP